MQALGIEWQTHIPAGKDGNRTTARSKGKVERAFIDQILADTLTRSVVLSRVRSYFRDQKRGEEHAS
jgi:hypothetical protein